MTTALIDGDILLYQVANACEEAIDWGDDIWTMHGDFKFAKQVMESELVSLTKAAKCQDSIVFLSGSRPNNWRLNLLPSYKANRKGKRKPLTYKPLRAHLESNFECGCVDILEADDLLGLHALEDVVIVSDDKDLLSIPATVYRPNTDERIEVSQEDADRFHLLQTLTGDAVDGYRGCPGVGPVAANRILDADCSWGAVVQAYEKQGLTEQDALVQARVARILRVGEFDWERMEVILWQPE